MGATASSAKRDSRCEEDAAEEELTAAASDAQDDGSPDDKVECMKSASCCRKNASQSFKGTISESKDTHGLYLKTQ